MITGLYENNRVKLREFHILPLFYSIPREPLVTRKLDNFPRNPFVAISSPHWRRLYHSIGWQGEVADVWTYLMWPHLGLRGNPSHYTINDPFVRLVYSLPMWAMLLAEAGLTCDVLASLTASKGGELPYISKEEAEHNCHHLADRFWKHPYLKAEQVRKIVQANRCHDDFAKRRTAVYIDFLRKYYHTRAKYSTISLEEAGDEYEYVTDTSSDLANVVSRDWIEKFYHTWLGNQKDIDICRLLYMGCTQKEIADRLDYANHSGINKRISMIRDMLDAFIQWQQELEEKPPAPRKAEIQYDMIPFSYKKK